MISEMMILPETITSRYGTQALCFKSSLIWNIVPNKFKNLGRIDLFLDSGSLYNCIPHFCSKRSN